MTKPVARSLSRPPQISVVVPTRNRAQRLEALLDSLGRITMSPAEYEVLVVDDRSSDATREMLERSAERLPYRLVPVAGEGGGPAVARNAGWAAARGRLVAFTDDDCEVDPGWLTAISNAAAKHPGAVIQGRTTPIPRERSRLGLLARTKLIERCGPWFQTCNIAYPRELLQKLGGFDESYTRPFGEDADLAWRALEAGAEVRFAPDALVHHAVDPLDVVGYLRDALRDPDEARLFKRHPALRWRIRRLWLFKSDAHALLGLAAAGGSLRRRASPLVLVLACAYGCHVAARCWAGRANPFWGGPLIAAHDAIELVQATRGAVRHRVPLV